MGQRDGFSDFDLQKINLMYCRNRPGYNTPGNSESNPQKPAPIPTLKPDNPFFTFMGAIFNKLVYGDEWEMAVNKTITELGDLRLDV